MPTQDLADGCKGDPLSTFPGMTRRLPDRSKSEGAGTLPQRMNRASRLAPEIVPSQHGSTESIVSYLGRSYSLKDIFPDLGSLSLKENDKNITGDQQEQQQKPVERRAPVKRIVRPSSSRSPLPVSTTVGMNGSRRTPARTTSAGAALLSATARETGERQERKREVPARSRSTGCVGNLSQMVASIEEERHRQEYSSLPGLLRSGTDVVKKVFGDHTEDGKYGIHSDTIKTLNYTSVDVANICDDKREFERLKATLKKKGAVTNTVLKQGLHFYVKAKKDREASLGPRRRRSRASSARRSASLDPSQETAPVAA